mmetsp:Transcript_4878/g.8829  ORF Transcript_4878/g.8829 Transcript_4878/m.8829 type:complete len:159 (-) Transcript_4878:129-605(-)
MQEEHTKKIVIDYSQMHSFEKDNHNDIRKDLESSIKDMQMKSAASGSTPGDQRTSPMQVVPETHEVTDVEVIHGRTSNNADELETPRDEDKSSKRRFGHEAKGLNTPEDVGVKDLDDAFEAAAAAERMRRRQSSVTELVNLQGVPRKSTKASTRRLRH